MVPDDDALPAGENDENADGVGERTATTDRKASPFAGWTRIGPKLRPSRGDEQRARGTPTAVRAADTGETDTVTSTSFPVARALTGFPASSSLVPS